MRLIVPRRAPDFDEIGVRGNRIRLSDYRGHLVMLSFFRDASCPFCNLRCYELAHSYKEWLKQGLKVIVFFRSNDADIHHYLTRFPCPFVIIGDPDMKIYAQYGIEHSAWAMLRGMTLRMPRMLLGMVKGPLPRLAADQTLVPADFLIDEHGLIQAAYYGRDIGDHIPITRIKTFIESRQYPGSVVMLREQPGHRPQI